jgi:hypothetical protein
MLTTDIQQDTYTGPVTLNPRWLRIPSAVKYSGLSRSRLYELIAEGSIKSICLKSHRDALRGVHLSSIFNVTINNDYGPVAALERPLPLLGFQRFSTPFNRFQ